MTVSKMNSLRQLLEEIAKRELQYGNDDGGKTDDAYFMGADDGEIYLARKILSEYFN